ncbi:hypothetical protein HK414_03230 [Ramlibacter terrae]|uniref:Uncharacterized protein n=1 Tax=Ramlibacter terrae TaxID=2732511 RepID=A0ABX6P0C1_9BURK|nr:hypothetical protein HK414_03230 [Ramlibacter terrae]
MIAGLRYEMSATNGTLVEGSEPNLAVVGNVGSPDQRPVTIGGSMPAGRAGTSGATASATRTLTVTF